MKESPDKIQMMWFFWLLLIVETASAAVCFWAVWRHYRYIRRYRFDESFYTLLFGFVRMRYFVYSYITAIFLTGLTSLIFVLSLFDHDFAA